MVESIGIQQSLEKITNLISEAKAWYIQVKNHKSDLEKLTGLSLVWTGGELSNIHNILLERYEPLELIIHSANLQQNIYDALIEAEESEGFPKLEDNYRSDVSDRFLQYMTELIRLTIIDKKDNINTIGAI